MLVAVVVACGLAGCGYQLDSPRLPNNAGTLLLAQVKNQTTTGELDIRLRQFLRARLQRHANVELVASGNSDMRLDTILSDLQITRARDLTSTNVSSIQYQLKGDVSLLDRRTGSYYFLHYPITVTSRLDFDAPVIETPAIRDEGLTGVLDKFAERIETVVLQGF